MSHFARHQVQASSHSTDAGRRCRQASQTEPGTGLFRFNLPAPWLLTALSSESSRAVTHHSKQLCGPPHCKSKRPPSLAVARRLSPRPAACHGHSVALTAASLATAITCRGQYHLPRPGQRAPPFLASALVSQVTCRDWTRRHPSHLRRPEFRVPRRLSESGSFAAAGPHSLRPASLAIRLTAKRYSPLPAVARHGPSPSLAAASRHSPLGNGSPPSHSPAALASGRHESVAAAAAESLTAARLTRRPQACRNHSGSPSRRDRDRPRRRPSHSPRQGVTRRGPSPSHSPRPSSLAIATARCHSPRFASLAITRCGPSGPSPLN